MLFTAQVLAYGVPVHAVAVLNAAGRLALGPFASVATHVVPSPGCGPGRGLHRLVRGGGPPAGRAPAARRPGVLAGTAGLTARLLGLDVGMVAIAVLVGGLVEGERTRRAVEATETVAIVTMASGAAYVLLVRLCAPAAVAVLTGGVRRPRDSP